MMLRLASLCLALPLVVSAPAMAQAPAIQRDATGQRLSALEQIELKPFPASWDTLTGWTSASGKTEAITSATISGKPVLIVTWASWNAASGKALSLAQRMHDRFAKDGLVIVAVHNPQGFDAAGAAQTAKDRGLAFPIAHDAKGDFRTAIKVDHDPSYTLIDRGGNLRFASVAAASVESAAETLVKESVKDASDLPRLLKERAAAALADSRKTGGIREDLNLSALPPVPPDFTPPPASAFKGLDWPKITGEKAKEWSLIDERGNPRENKLGFRPSQYFPATPEPRGRAYVIYVLNAHSLGSYDKVLTQMDVLQQQYARDLVVIGSLVPFKRADGGEERRDKPEDLSKKFQEFTKSRVFKHTLALDPASTTTSFMGSGDKFDAVPAGALVVSSDGVIRWGGSVDSPGFKYALDTVLSIDPGIKARREADREFISKQK